MLCGKSLVFSLLFLFSFVLSVYRPTASNKPLDLFKLVIVKYQRIPKGQSRHTDNIGYPRLRQTKHRETDNIGYPRLRQTKHRETDNIGYPRLRKTKHRETDNIGYPRLRQTKHNTEKQTT